MEKLGIKGWGGKSPNTVYAADIVRTRLKRTCMPTLPIYSFHLIEVLETSSVCGGCLRQAEAPSEDGS